MSKSWSDYFKDSMDSLGLPVPTSLYGDAVAALAAVKAIQGAIAIGGDVTIGELIGAGLLAEELAVAGAVLASFYVGALIGAAIYATASVGWDWMATLNGEGIDYSQIDYTAYAQSGEAQYAADTQTA
jgi:hypothetical protein